MGSYTSRISGQDAPFAGIPRVVAPSNLDTSPEKRDRTLRHCLRANHHNFAVLYSNARFHNHMPHVLGSAYLLGASPEHIQALYDEESQELDPWASSPHEVTEDDWRDFLGDRAFQRAYLDFFEDELTRNGYDWKAVVAKTMLSGPNPLIYGIFGGLGHPLIHLGYAFELNSKDVATEALALTTTNHNFLHKYILDEFPVPGTPITPPPSNASTSPLALLAEIQADARLDGLFKIPGASNMEPLFHHAEKTVLEYFHRLTVTDAKSIHHELSRATALLLVATHEPGSPAYDFFICHLLTTSYAVRVLLPELPAAFAPVLLKAHWLFVIVVYCTQLRPLIRPELVDAVDTHGRSWDDVVQHAIAQKKGDPKLEDTHYLKSVRTFKESATLWGEEDGFWIKAAHKIAWEFEIWGGFGTAEERDTNIAPARAAK